MDHPTKTSSAVVLSPETCQRHVLAVLVCLGEKRQRDITERCERHYGMRAFEVSQALEVLEELEVIERVRWDEEGIPFWSVKQHDIRKPR